MTNDKKLMLLAGVLALGMLAGCSSASAASAASGMAGSMPAASEAEEVSSEVRVLPGEEGVIMPIDQGSLEEMKTGSYKFAANISSVDAKKRQMTLTVYGYDAYRAEECAWLKKAVRSEEFLTASARIVLLHIPPAAGAWHGSVHLNELFVPGLNEAGIDLMLCGHYHRYHWIDDGSRGVDFPILVNSNNDCLRVSADAKGIDLKVVNTAGAVIKQHRIDKKNK